MAKVDDFGMPRAAIRATLNELRQPFRIAIDRAKNPFNIGSIIRTAHSFLASEIILIGADPWYERAAMGMQRLENLREVPTTQAFLDLAQHHHWPIVAFEREHAREALWEAPFPASAVLVFGNEDDGIHRHILQAAHRIVAIPMFGINNSYPVTVAAGIAMAEWTRQHVGSWKIGT